MATKREERELSEFFKFKQVGQTVAGFIETFGKSGKYDTHYAVFEPVVILADRNAKPKLYGSVAIGLSANLLSKLRPRQDAQKYFSIQFTGTKPSAKGSPTKLFEVLELEEREYLALANKAIRDNEMTPFKHEQDESEQLVDSEDDDLPF